MIGGELDPFRPALRPEFAADLEQMAGATRYELDLQLDPSTLEISGDGVVHYTNREDVALDAVYFRLYPNFPGCHGQAEVTAVQAGGETVKPAYQVERTALRVPLDPPLEPGEAVVLDLHFEVEVPEGDLCRYGDFSYSGGIMALAHFYPIIPAYDDEGWNIELGPSYGDLVYADASLYHVTMTLPAGWVVAASGTEVSRTSLDEGRARISWVSGPGRDFFMALSRDYLTRTQEVGDVQVTAYFLSGDRAGGEQALDYAVRALQLYQKRFGPYRYREFDVVETPTLAGGIEYPGVVVIAGSMYGSEGGYLEVTVVHEAAHQWWYNLIGDDQVDEPWLDEALATYSSIVFFEEEESAAAGESLLRYYRGSYQAMVDGGQDAPVNRPVGAYDENQYYAIVYAKGALFFDALRREVGDRAFWAILQRYYERYLYGIASGEGLLQVAEEVSGKDLQGLYERWILSPQ